jgi:DNA-binding HxlR family transcriptional regulator
MKIDKTGPAAERRSLCPIATTLDIIGDKWTLVVVRDLLTGKRRYGEFLTSPEGIPTNILADRLKRLELEGLIEKRPYQQRPLRNEYLLTEKGTGLLPVLQAICRWGNRYFPGTWTPPESFMELTVEN